MPAEVDAGYQTLESFFFDEIENAQERSGTSLSPEVEAYVVHLLARYARRPHAAGRKSGPLALEYLRARGETGTSRASALKGVGDRALYIAGVAPRSLDRTPVNVRYVCGIGEAAYREVAARTSPLTSGALMVLSELAERFDAVAEVIGDVVDLGASATGRPDDLLGLYDRWRRHRDPRDAKRLVAAGVIIDSDGSDVLQ
jgi:hypothetical protein